MRVGLGSAPTFAFFIYVIVPLLYAYLSESATLPVYCV